MGKITASCGHEISLDWLDDPASRTLTKSRTRAGQKAICYATDCVECRTEWIEAGILFTTEEEANAWLAKPWADDEAVR